MVNFFLNEKCQNFCNLSLSPSFSLSFSLTLGVNCQIILNNQCKRGISACVTIMCTNFYPLPKQWSHKLPWVLELKSSWINTIFWNLFDQSFNIGIGSATGVAWQRMAPQPALPPFPHTNSKVLREFIFVASFFGGTNFCTLSFCNFCDLKL